MEDGINWEINKSSSEKCLVFSKNIKIGDLNAQIRMATPEDADGILEIYTPIITSTPITFEVDPLSVDQMANRMSKILETHPWLVCEFDNKIIGYAYACKHHERAAYRWSVDVSCYVHQEWHKKRIGHQLYTELFNILRQLGYYNVFAGIGLPNPGSIALHESMGMTFLGKYQNVGYKLGKWHDVGWWQRDLQQPKDNPKEPQLVRVKMT